MGWQSSNTVDTYLGGAWFESQLGHQLSGLRFLIVSLNPSRHLLDHHNFLANPFQTIILLSFIHLMLYSPATESIIK
jgi:hypothetical protein